MGRKRTLKPGDFANVSGIFSVSGRRRQPTSIYEQTPLKAIAAPKPEVVIEAVNRFGSESHIEI